MYSYCSNNLLNIKDVFIKKVVHADFYVKVFIETKPSPQTCPCCGSITKRIHDYRIQPIKDLPFQTKYCFLVLRKRRYVCSCGKKFYYIFCSYFINKFTYVCIHNVSAFLYKINDSYIFMTSFDIYIILFCYFKFTNHFTQVFCFAAHLLAGCSTFLRCRRIGLYNIINLFNSFINLLDFCCLCL